MPLTSFSAYTWPIRVMYILIAAALGIGLFITAIPAYSQDIPGQRQTLRGYPVRVGAVCGNGSSSISAVITDKKGNNISCRGFDGCDEVTNAAALIRSEIEDNDTEMVEFEGKYNGELFNIESVSANGYTVKLSK